MIVAGYSRVSTSEQAEHGYSIKEQEERIKAYCQAKDWTLLRVYSDPGYSGAKTDRPGLQAMISDINAGQIDAVLVYKLDRLSRSQKDALYLIEDVFLKSGVQFISISENFDTSTPLGRAMVGILAVFAQLEREQIKERMILGKTARAKTGKWQGGKNTPVGYALDKGKGLSIDENEAVYVRMIFDLFTAGENLESIERELQKIGAKSRYGVFTRININRMLGNPVYTGKLVYKGEIYDAAHDAIISEEQFQKAQEIRTKNHDLWERNIRGSKNPSLLAGLLFCAQCGSKYHRVRWRPELAPRYVCYSRDKRLLNMVKDPDCKNKTYLESELDNMILSEIKKLIADPVTLKQVINPEKKKAPDRSPGLRNQLIKLRKQRARYIDLYALDNIDLATIRERLTEVNSQISEIEKELENLSVSDNQIRKQISSLPDNAGDIIDFGNTEEKRALVRALIKRIDIDGDNITINWAFF